MTTVRFVTRLALALAVVLALAPRAHAQNPFTIDGNVPDAGTLRTPDPAGNTSELSPLNGANYKLGVIHLVGSTPSNPLPVLGFTTQPSKVDLNAVWTQVKKAADGDQWFYFGWSRDAPNGSGFISIEMQHAAAPTSTWSPPSRQPSRR
jgi:hypothetical protein